MIQFGKGSYRRLMLLGLTVPAASFAGQALAQQAAQSEARPPTPDWSRWW